LGQVLKALFVQTTFCEGFFWSKGMFGKHTLKCILAISRERKDVFSKHWLIEINNKKNKK
jgi:hypothetical protein